MYKTVIIKISSSVSQKIAVRFFFAFRYTNFNNLQIFGFFVFDNVL